MLHSFIIKNGINVIFCTREVTVPRLPLAVELSSASSCGKSEVVQVPGLNLLCLLSWKQFDVKHWLSSAGTGVRPSKNSPGPDLSQGETHCTLATRKMCFCHHVGCVMLNNVGASASAQMILAHQCFFFQLQASLFRYSFHNTQSRPCSNALSINQKRGSPGLIEKKKRPHILSESKPANVKPWWRKSAPVDLLSLRDHRSRVFPAVFSTHWNHVCLEDSHGCCLRNKTTPSKAFQ